MNTLQPETFNFAQMLHWLPDRWASLAFLFSCFSLSTDGSIRLRCDQGSGYW
jgi:hypothetical protein